MKHNIIPALKLTAIMLLVCMGVYTLIVLGFAQLMPNHGKGKMIFHKGKTYYDNIAQKFDTVIYFNSRPSGVDYNASGSGGSNKGPTNPEYLKEVQKRVDNFKSQNSGVEVPVDMVTASGSGLDPHITPAAAYAQAARVAKARNMETGKVKDLIEKHIEKPFFGPQKINVLKLNIDLDELK